MTAGQRSTTLQALRCFTAWLKLDVSGSGGALLPADQLYLQHRQLFTALLNSLTMDDAAVLEEAAEGLTLLLGALSLLHMLMATISAEFLPQLGIRPVPKLQCRCREPVRRLRGGAGGGTARRGPGRAVAAPLRSGGGRGGLRARRRADRHRAYGATARGLRKELSRGGRAQWHQDQNLT